MPESPVSESGTLTRRSELHQAGSGGSAVGGDGHGGFRSMPGSPFALAGCTNPRRVAAGSVYRNKLHDFAVTCTNNSTILLFIGQKDGGLQLSSFDVHAAVPAGPAERGILMADLLRRGRDDIIVSNGPAGTITILFSK